MSKHTCIIYSYILCYLVLCTGCFSTIQKTNSIHGKLVQNTMQAIDSERCHKEGKIGVRPFIVTWDATEQAELVNHIAESLMLVRVDQCKVEMLLDCLIPGKYTVRNTGGNLESLIIDNQQKLYASLPLGLWNFGGNLKRFGGLNLTYYVSGIRTGSALEIYRAQLKPACRKATHLIRSMSVGAFKLKSSEKISVGMQLKGSQIGKTKANQKGRVQVLFKGGKLDTCHNHGKQCQTPLRLRLTPIVEKSPKGLEKYFADLALSLPKVAKHPPIKRLSKLKITQGISKVLKYSEQSCINEFPLQWKSNDMTVLSLSMYFLKDGTPEKVELKHRKGIQLF